MKPPRQLAYQAVCPVSGEPVTDYEHKRVRYLERLGCRALEAGPSVCAPQTWALQEVCPLSRSPQTSYERAEVAFLTFFLTRVMQEGVLPEPSV